MAKYAAVTEAGKLANKQVETLREAMTRRGIRENPIPRGPFTVWINYGCEGWQWTDHATLEGAISADKYGSEWVLTRPVSWAPQEMDDQR